MSTTSNAVLMNLHRQVMQQQNHALVIHTIRASSLYQFDDLTKALWKQLLAKYDIHTLKFFYELCQSCVSSGIKLFTNNKSFYYFVYLLLYENKFTAMYSHPEGCSATTCRGEVMARAFAQKGKNKDQIYAIFLTELDAESNAVNTLAMLKKALDTNPKNDLHTCFAAQRGLTSSRATINKIVKRRDLELARADAATLAAPQQQLPANRHVATEVRPGVFALQRLPLPQQTPPTSE
tara:strand:- start:5837 stop:6544 length:708 start_codon:yes stop_codon:yes gene_type:complete